MSQKLPQKYRGVIFALLMSCITSLMVSGIISIIHQTTVTAWIKAFVFAWPMVFLSIITIAPRISRLVDGLVERS